MKKISLIMPMVLFLLPFAFAQEALPKYKGETPADTEFARQVYEMNASSGVVGVEVFQSVLAVHVSEALYKKMSSERGGSEAMIKEWQKLIARHFDKKNALIGTVWVYFAGNKVAICDNIDINSSGIRVIWLDR